MSGSGDDNPPTTVDSADDVGIEEYSEEEVEEVEVTDDEDGTDGEVAKLPLSPPSKSSGKAKSDKKPGKVQPTKEVKQAPMESPESMSKKSTVKFSPDKNPFGSNGVWNASTLGKIQICFPTLTGKNETTNELTRSTRPEARYWKGVVAFKYSNFTSETLRFDNVHIPFHTGKGYGDNFVYLMLPPDAAEAFSVAAKKVAPTKVIENSLMPDSQRWWKIANKVEGQFGVVNASNHTFQSKSLSTIFDSTQSGISCSVVLRFYCKASTDEKEPLKSTTPRSISVEVTRGYITGVDINVQLPTKVNREKAKVAPTATTRDIATDSLMQRLSDLGL